MPFEPRKFVRYRLKVPVRFSWKDSQGRRHRAAGTTRDISPGGMFLFARTCPPVGVPVGLRASLPRFNPNVAPWLMVARGRVVRVEPASEGAATVGFATVSDERVLRVVET